jgi:single-strand DNA-binding protein
MNNLNSILIEGNIRRDPELSYGPNGTIRCKFILDSVHLGKEDGKTTEELCSFSVQTAGSSTEIQTEHLKRGRGVRVVGRLKQDRWTDTEGAERSAICIIAEHVELKPNLKTEKEKA